ncbi:MAG: hypothetical protein QM702_24110 [Rubrivivax sp.]
MAFSLVVGSLESHRPRLFLGYHAMLKTVFADADRFANANARDVQVRGPRSYASILAPRQLPPVLTLVGDVLGLICETASASAWCDPRPHPPNHLKTHAH